MGQKPKMKRPRKPRRSQLEDNYPPVIQVNVISFAGTLCFCSMRLLRNGFSVTHTFFKIRQYFDSDVIQQFLQESFFGMRPVEGRCLLDVVVDEPHLQQEFNKTTLFIDKQKEIHELNEVDSEVYSYVRPYLKHEITFFVRHFH